LDNGGKDIRGERLIALSRLRWEVERTSEISNMVLRRFACCPGLRQGFKC